MKRSYASLSFSKLSFLVGFTLSSCAHSSPSWMYAGFSHGWTTTDLHISKGGDDGLPNIGKGVSSSADSLFLGHESVFSSDYLWGGEIFAGTQNLDVNSYARQKYNFGAKIKIGRQVADKTALYAHLSGIYSVFQFPTQFSGVKNKGAVAIAPGVGIKVDITPRWALHGDASYALYNSISSGAATTRNVIAIKPRQFGISIGASYKFCEQ